MTLDEENIDDPYSIHMDDSAFPSMGRPSIIGNEDDYDYAIELFPNDEYRLVAKDADNIINFDEIDEETIQKYHSDKHSSYYEEKEVSDTDESFNLDNYDDNNIRENKISVDINDSKNTTISYQDFVWKLGILKKQKKWIESVRRR